MSDIRTRLAQAGHAIDAETGAVIPPIHPATTFARGSDNQLLGPYMYSRTGNPTNVQAERLIADLDGAAESLLFASGMGAAVCMIDSLKTGEHVTLPDTMYHGVKNWFIRQRDRRGIGLDFFVPSKPDALAAAIRPGKTRMVWIETPINPTWDVIDIAAAAEAAHRAAASLVVDATVAPAVTMKPLALGADIVFQSATKYLNGHSDVTAGVLSVREINPLWEEVRATRIAHGAMLGAFETWLLIRGLRTLFIRFDQASKNALAIATAFEKHPKLEAVLYPGLASHPGHAIARRQMTNGFGGMMSLLIKGGEEAARRFTGALEVFTQATSLGGVESLAEHRRPIEGPGSTVAPNLVRLSIGIEAVDDLIADIAQALERL